MGNRTGLTYPGDKTATYLYDEMNQLKEVTDWKGRKTTYSYDEVGNRTKTSLPNGVVTDYLYDEMNRVTGISSGIGKGKEVLSFGYEYDELGNKTSENKNGKSESYEYDALSQLVKAMPETGKETRYSYDAVGNRLTRQEANAASLLTTSYQYNEADELLKVTEHSGPVTTEGEENNCNGTSYEYDQNGNRIKKSVLSVNCQLSSVDYTYDYENRLKEVIDYKGKATSFEYDGEGNRIRKATKNPDEVEPQAKNITEYVWDRTPRLPDGRRCPQVLQTYNGDGALQSSFPYGKERIADVKDTNTNYFMLDELGSVMALTDEKGNVVSHYDYDEFGVPLPFDNLNKGGNRLSNLFGYTGEEYDEELGLLNLRARSYEPETGRFLQ